MTDATDEVKRVIARALRVPLEQLSDDARLRDLGAESIDIIEIMFQLEEKFDIELTVKTGKAATSDGADDRQKQLKLEDFETVGDVCRAIETIAGAKAS